MKQMILAKHPRYAIILNCEKGYAMKNGSRLIFYILLNIFVTSVTILTILWLWERAHPTPIFNSSATSPQVQNSTLPVGSELNNDPAQTSESEIEFSDQGDQVSIYAIVGAGNLDMEYVEIRNEGQGAVDLTGWQIRDENNQTFTFPAFILNSQGAIKVLSKSGNPTVIELFWQSETPIWQSGETASLLNDAGETISTYSIP